MTCSLRTTDAAPDVKAVRENIHLLPSNLSVVVLPDFFFDHFIHYDGNLASFFQEIERVAERGGGNLIGPKQFLLRGGNSANFASALACLGIRTYMIGRTSKLGKVLLNHFLGQKGVDLSLLKDDGQIGLTSAIELRYKSRLVNIMVSDSGSIADFSEEHIGDGGLEAIKKADCVCVFSWNHMKKGNAIAQKVFSYCKRAGKGITYLDTGDPTFSPTKGVGLVKGVLSKSLVDIFSVNENEATFFADQIRLREKVGGSRSEMSNAIEKVRFLHRELDLELDLHTAKLAFAVVGDEEFIMPTYSVSPLRTTGAGDAWNAGNVFGLLSKMTTPDRLAFANAVAAYYLCEQAGEHGNVSQILRFMEKVPLRKLEPGVWKRGQSV